MKFLVLILLIFPKLLLAQEVFIDSSNKEYLYLGSTQNKYIEANLEGYSIQFDSENKTATSTKTCGDVVIYSSNVLLKKLYYFNNKEKKYTYIDKYCEAIPDGVNYYLRQCTKKERLDCEKAVVEVGDEP